MDNLQIEIEEVKGTARNRALNNISKEELQEYYSCHTRNSTCNYFNITIGTLQWLLKFYNIKKTKEQKMNTLINEHGDLDTFYNNRNLKSTQTKIEKYGSIEEFEKRRADKMIEGRIRNYGSTENYIKQMTETYINTCVEKYGVKNVSQLESVKDKKKESLISHFGSLENAYEERQSKSNETWISKYGSLDNYRKFQQELSRQACLERYGVENPFQTEEVKEKIIATNLERYGVEYACMLDTCRSNGKNDSKPNRDFMQFLQDNEIIIDQREFPLGNYIYDFKIGKLLFEINPYATHNSTWSPFGNNSGISKYYHQLKSKNAFNFGYRCIHVFDWDDRDIIIENIKNNKYEIEKQEFSNPRLYIYDTKNKKLVDDVSENCVEIYDDGIILAQGGI